MRQSRRVFVVVAIAAGLWPAGGVETWEAEPPESKGKQEEKGKEPPKGPGKQPNEDSTKDAGKQQLRTAKVQLLVTAEGRTKLPSDSRVVLEGGQGCGELATQQSGLSSDGKASFPDVPLCQVRLRITIPGFETKFARVDLTARDGAPIKIQVKANGPPVIE